MEMRLSAAPTRSPYSQVVTGNGWGKETVSVGSECVIFLSNSRRVTLQSGMRCVLLAFPSSRDSKKKWQCTVCAGLRERERDYSRAMPRHTRRQPTSVAPPSRWILVSHTRCFPYNKASTKDMEWQLHGYLKSTFISLGHLS